LSATSPPLASNSLSPRAGYLGWTLAGENPGRCGWFFLSVTPPRIRIALRALTPEQGGGVGRLHEPKSYPNHGGAEQDSSVIPVRSLCVEICAGRIPHFTMPGRVPRHAFPRALPGSGARKPARWCARAVATPLATPDTASPKPYPW